ncbi:FecR family protein [Duganella sp. CF517]|uniref:FecR domain-containing protein n=1 Tax=Duganella sp. CF517 TaxID=1881038 RepID=UPI0008CB324A|nr:FecR domain-containing protein [Duganella sp. CF517]SEO01606.1 FecR family protein [Duganella sp. CF517]
MTTPPIPSDVRAQAVDWLVELQSELADDDLRRRWRLWHDADPAHAQAWARVEAFGDKLQSLQPDIAHATLDGARSEQRRTALKTLAMLMGVGGAAWLAGEEAPWREWSADHRTRVGERAVLMLDDGTRVRMNADTALNIRYTASARMLQLLRGEILVTTAHEPAFEGVAARPFSVDTAEGSARALGTHFQVRRLDGRSVVSVLAGAVEIRPAGGGAAVRLGAGRQAGFTSAGVGPVAAVDDAIAAWIDGMLVAQDMPLPEFLAALNRYRPGHLRCAPSAARLTVSGTYPLADSDKVLDTLQTTLPVKVDRYTRYWVSVGLKK